MTSQFTDDSMDEDRRGVDDDAAPQASGPARALVILFGEQTFRIGLGDMDRKALTLGRDRKNDLVAPQKFVSRRHATIELLRDRFVFTDCSANGTYIQHDGGDILHIHGAKIFLDGAGVFSLGLHLDKPEALRIRFHAE